MYFSILNYKPHERIRAVAGVSDPVNDYSYDTNGNMTADQNKGITDIKYNHLNLPVKIVFNNDNNTRIEYLYNAVGEKLRKIVYQYCTTCAGGISVVTTDYLDGFQYTNNVLSFFPHAEGYVNNTFSGGNNIYNYVYNYTDHLGNVRVSYTWDTATSSLKILEENHYYPYGFRHGKYNVESFVFVPTTIGRYNTGTIVGKSSNVRNLYQYKLNGKEYQDELGLNMYAMDMRQYDPAIARWVVQDPITHHSQSPYNGFDGNPVFWADPSGGTTQNFDFSRDQTGRDKFDRITGMYIAPMDRGDERPDVVDAQNRASASSGRYFDNATGYWIKHKTDNRVSNDRDNGDSILEEILITPIYEYEFIVNSTSGGCPNCLNPSTTGHNIFYLTYPGGNNPKSYNGQYNYSYVPTNLSEYPAIGHDRRYDNLKITGASGLFTDTRAIGADWRFVSEELSIAGNPFLNPVDRISAGLLGVGLGLSALPKTLFQLSTPSGNMQTMMWYNISNQGVNNAPTIHKH